MPRLQIVFPLIIALVLAGCGAGGGSGGAATAVEDYLQAIVDKEPDTVINLSCAAWEEDARTEVDSFQAVDVTLRDPACTCTGALVTTYDGEDQEIDLSRRTYRVVSEGGEWRMCGYQE
jgi:hypothetical protein